jgi:hypothetical protein
VFLVPVRKDDEEEDGEKSAKEPAADAKT